MKKPAKPIVKDNVLLACVETSEELREACAIQLGSAAWVEWLGANTRFVFEGGTGHFTARREIRRNTPYWYAYRRRGGKLFKAYLGRSEELTQARFEQVSMQLTDRVPQGELSSSYAPVELWSYPASSLVAANDGFNVDSTAAGTAFSILPMTKFKPPTLPGKLIGRPRLTHRIKSPVTLIYAPSGFGKSTLLNEWRQENELPVAWVSLDADDDQPTRFWFTLALALQTINPDLGRAWLTQFLIASPSDLSQVAVALANEVVRITDAEDSSKAQGARRLGLALDDYHHIHHPEIHASLQTFLEHLPSSLQLVVSSRTKPPLILGQLRARGMVSELETDDLRFTLEEGIDFLWQYTANRHLSYGEMQALVKHTEGWVAGLHLAALTLAQQSDRHELMTSFSGAHTYLREYFTESVLYRQPPHIQSFLFKTSILKHLTASLCDAVTEQHDGNDILEQLWQENLFLVRLEEPGWYRYHDLFAEMLYSQLQVQFPAQIPRLHRRAAEWYRAQNAPADAVYHLLAIQAWEEAAALIERMALRELEQSGEDSRLLRWLHQLPESVVQQHKTLLSVYVRLAASALPHAEVDGFLKRVEANIMSKPDDERTSDERDVLVDIRRIRDIARTGYSLVSQLTRGGENEAVWQLLDGILLYQRFNCPELKRATTIARTVYETAKAQKNLFVILMSGGTLANYSCDQGELRECDRIAHQVLRHALAQRGLLPEPSSIALTALGQVCYHRNQLAQAHQFLLRATEVDPNPMSSNLPITVAVQRAKIEAAQGKGEAAQATLQAARELHAMRPGGTWFDRDLIAYQALIYVRLGDGENAERLLSDISEGDMEAFVMLVRAEILLFQGQYAGAEELFSRLLIQFPYGFHHEPIMGVRIGLANALFGWHKVNEARQVMTEAVRLAAPEAFIRPFLDKGIQSAPLLTLLLQTETLTVEAQTFVKEILRMVGQVEGEQDYPNKDESMALVTAASISVREHEVLRLVSAGLSNREIADEFSISVSTVKTHLDNIYRKLGVNSRTQAVAEAQQLKLV